MTSATVNVTTASATRPVPEAVTRLVDQSLGARVVDLVAIKANVARASGLDGAPGTVIVKGSRPKLASTSAPDGHHAEFEHERLNHQFLDQLRPGFTATPRLLGATDRLLLLEDLGRSPAGSTDGLGDALAHSLATLHDATARDRDRYERMRDAAGLAVDHRMYSHEQYRRLFTIGARSLLGECNELDIDVTRLGQALDAAADIVVGHPGAQALVHDDVLSTRQVVMRDRVCHLLDWEMGKLAHPLADVAKVLLGKLDRKAHTNAYVLKHMDLDLAFADRYRQLRTGDERMCDDAVWRRQLGSLLLHTTVVNLGAQSCVVPGHRPLDGAAALRRRILQRVIELDVDNPTHRGATDTIRRVLDATGPEGVR